MMYIHIDVEKHDNDLVSLGKPLANAGGSTSMLVDKRVSH